MMKRNILAKKILCGLLAAGVLGVSGSALAANGIEAKAGQDINGNERYSDGKIDGVSYGLKAQGVFTKTSPKQTSKISLTTENIDINASMEGASGKQLASLTIGDDKTNNISIVGNKRGIYLDKGSSAVVEGKSVKIIGTGKGTDYAAILVNNKFTSPKMTELAQLEIKGEKIEIEAANVGVDARGQFGDGLEGANIIIGNVLTESINILGQGNASTGVSSQTNAAITGTAKNITIESFAKGVTASVGNASITLNASNDLAINASGSGSVQSVYSSAVNGVSLSGNNLNINAVGNGNGSSYSIYAENEGTIAISGGVATINSSGGTSEKDNYGLNADNGGKINVNTDKVTIGVEKTNGNAYGIYINSRSSSQGSNIIIGKDSSSDVHISSVSDKTAFGVVSTYVKNGGGLNVPGKDESASTTIPSTPTNENIVPGSVDILASNISVTAEGNKAYGLYATDGNKINVGNDDSVINVAANGKKDAVGIFTLTQGQVNFNGDELNVNAASGETSVGILAQNNTMTSTDEVATVNVNAAKTVINAKTGIAAYSQGVVNMNNGDVEINAEKAIETRGNAVTNINQDGTHTVKLNGDIVFDVTNDGNSGLNADATVNVNLSNAESSLTGSVKTAQSGTDSDKINMDVNGMKMNIANDAAWNMTGDSFVNSASVSNGGSINVQEGVSDFTAGSVDLNKGNINLNGNNQDVNITSLNGNGGTVNTNSLDNTVFVETKGESTKIAVNGSSNITDQIASGEKNLQDLANVVTNMDEKDNKSLASTVTSEANDIIGGYSAEVGENGKIVAGSEKTVENTTNRAISDMASISLMTWRQENNDMNKRLGELRDSKGEHGAWARMARGESKYGAQNVKNQYNYYQVGYDEKLSVNPNWTVGVALTRTEGNSTFATGCGENKHTGFAVYGSYLADNGSFIDLIAKYARMDNDYKTIGAGVGDADYETNGYSLSAEYGKRFTKDNGFWIEPQVELTYGKVGSASYTTSKGANVYQDGVDSLVGRLGFSLGKDIKQGNVYVRASYLYDFDGETTAYMSKAGAGATKFEQDLGGGWWEVGVGTNLNLSDATHLYFDVEKTYGGNVATPWQWNAGVRWSF